MNTTFQLPSQSVSKLNQLAEDIHANLVFTSYHLRRPEDVNIVFMSLPFMPQAERQAYIAAGVDMIYEYFEQAGPHACNGYPMFLSARFLNRADTKYVLDRVSRIEAAIKSLDAPRDESPTTV